MQPYEGNGSSAWPENAGASAGARSGVDQVAIMAPRATADWRRRWMAGLIWRFGIKP
jgi:hypothetical protein